VARPVRSTVIAPVIAGVLAVSAIALAGTIVQHGSITGQPAKRHLAIHGHVRHLMPGRPKILRVHVRNPLNAGVAVYQLRAVVRTGRGRRGACPAQVIHIRPWKGFRKVAASSRRTFRLRIRLRKRVPDRCQGARWTIRSHARSVRL
jgi:hypothetical protein